MNTSPKITFTLIYHKNHCFIVPYGATLRRIFFFIYFCFYPKRIPKGIFCKSQLENIIEQKNIYFCRIKN